MRHTNSPTRSRHRVCKESAVATAQDIDRTGTRSGIVAHHLLVGDKIAQTFAALGNGREKTVVILSPNHFDAGRSIMQTTDGTWETAFGDVEVDTDVLEELLDGVEGMGYESETFVNEQRCLSDSAVCEEVFPDAKIVPIVIHDDATTTQIVDLAAYDPGGGSASDCTRLHRHVAQPQSIFAFLTTRRHSRPLSGGTCGDVTIVGGDRDCHLEIDANDVLETLFWVNQLRGTQEWHPHPSRLFRLLCRQRVTGARTPVISSATLAW